MAGVLHITIESAADLKDKSLLKMMDPYVAVRLGHHKAKTKKRQQGSSSSHPVFKQTLTLPLPELKAAAAAAPHSGASAAYAPHQQLPPPVMPGFYPTAAAAASAAAAHPGTYPAAAAPTSMLVSAPQQHCPYPVFQQHPAGGYPILTPHGYHLPLDAVAHVSKPHKQKGSDCSKDTKHKGKKGGKGESKPGQLGICVMAGLKRERRVRKAAEMVFAGAMALMSMMDSDDEGDSNNNEEEEDDEDEEEEKDELIGKATLDLTPFINGTAPTQQQQMQLPLISKKGKHNGYVQFTLRIEAKPAVIAVGGTYAPPSLAPPQYPSMLHAQQHGVTAAAAAAPPSSWMAQYAGQVPPAHGSSMCAYSYQSQGPYANIGQAY